MTARRRVPGVGGDLPTLHPDSEAAQRLQAAELDLDPEILKIWEDFENEEFKPLDKDAYKERPFFTNNMIWFLLMTLVGTLLFFANYFSTKELHRLRTETQPMLHMKHTKAIGGIQPLFIIWYHVHSKIPTAME